jgi:hypothetical protein
MKASHDPEDHRALRGKKAVPSSASKAGRALLALLMVAMFMMLGVREGRTDTTMGEEWEEHVEKLKAKGEDVKVMRSKSMTQEKSPEEFLRRYKKVREKAGKSFTFQTFVEDVARGLVIEQKYLEAHGVFYIKKENRNPNYQWMAGEELILSQKYLSVNYDKFCITPELLRDIFGKEDSIVTFEEGKAKSYDYDSMGIYFGVYFISGMNKKCVKEIGFKSAFYYRIEQ